MHESLPINNSVELIDLQPTDISPLISSCKIKVCYISDKPNRNDTVITRETALNISKSLRGSVIVGRFLEETEDFNQHDRELAFDDEGNLLVDDDGKLVLIDVTRPYGFVDINANVWFEKFLDDDNVEREYLVTEGYIWTGVYPESQRIIDKGNNQSMELTDVFGQWTTSSNPYKEFFIINDAVIEKLCILGEDVEPCFEGAQIKSTFSLQQQFNELKTAMFSMFDEFQKSLDQSKGVKEAMQEKLEVMEQGTEEVTTIQIEVEDKPAEEFAQAKEKDKEVDASEKSEEKEAEDNTDDKTDTSDEEKNEESVDEDKEKEPTKENACQDEKEKKYDLAEVEEYQKLSQQFEELQNKYAALETEVESLREFKLQAEHQSKEEMIDSFYMLSDEDKAEVRANIDTYSVEDIKAKLAVICVDKKVSFSQKNETEEEDQLTFNLNQSNNSSSNTAETEDWVLAVKEVQNSL